MLPVCEQAGQLMTQGRELVLRVVPLAEGDCLSCKLIGSGAMWGAATFVLLSYSRAKARYTGYKRTLFTVQALSLVTGKVHKQREHILLISSQQT